MDYQYGPAPPRPDYSQASRPYQGPSPGAGPTRPPPPRGTVPDYPKQHIRGRARYYYDSDSETESDFSDEEDDRSRRLIRRGAQTPREARTPSPPRRQRSTKASSRGGGGGNDQEKYTVAKACKAAAMSAAVEAVRCRAEPGPWNGQKGARCATAAVTGGLFGALRNGRLKANGKLPIADAAVTGFYAVDFLKRVLRQTEFSDQARKMDEEEGRGSDDDYDEDDRRARRRSRSRMRSRSRGVSRSRSRPKRRVEYHEWEASPVRGR
ncbi:hypothetical protein SLS56_012098 [Neofusicoccum ribis]|uniref:Uncharacterized protein n=1 Tax=Neofusicoccum ribis TaxID=45134 RepID=A0ABR3S9T6_9PEZI